MSKLHPSFCRLCHNGCAILVEVQDGRVARILGDRHNPVYGGYTCVKGRELPAQHNHPDRLLHSLKRMPDGSFKPIPVEQAMDEVAERLRVILDRDGPRSIAGYLGTYMIANPTTASMWDAFMDAIGSPMCFTANTIDQPGKPIAKALHGMWLAPPQGFHEPKVALLIGANPLVSHLLGVPIGNPQTWLKAALKRGLKLIVIDPRRTETARHACLYLQPKPGQDIPILAALLRVIIDEGLYDHEFVMQNVSGLAKLRHVVEPFSPAEVARRADVPADGLVEAARIFATAGRGYAVAGTGPNMSGQGTLLEYLILNLDTLCGHYLRAGERVLNVPTFLPPQPAKAQALPPFPGYGFGEQMRVRGLRETLAGMPTAALSDEILLDGEGQVKALFSVGGNPVAAWPDQLKTIKAMKRLELLVQVDIKMSATAQLAHYVIAPKLTLEMPGFSVSTDLVSLYAAGCGAAVANGQYTPAIVRPPAGSDLIEEWELFYGLAQRLGLPLNLSRIFLWPLGGEPIPLDMTHKPTTDEIFSLMTKQARISLDEVKKHPHGATFLEPAVYVEPKDPGWLGRLDVANPQMMADLEETAREGAGLDTQGGEAFGFRLISRRMLHVYNSSARDLPSTRGRLYNPAFMHPGDLKRLGLKPGAVVEIRSERAAILGVVEGDEDVREGVISMTHAFGDVPEYDSAVRRIGGPTSRLSANDREYERYSGQPRMSSIPVEVRRFAGDLVE